MPSKMRQHHHGFLSVAVTWEGPWLTLEKQESWLPFSTLWCSNACLRMCGGRGVRACTCVCVCGGAHVHMCWWGRPGTRGDTVATSSCNVQPCSGWLCGTHVLWGLAPRWEEAWLDVTSHRFFPARWPVHAVFISFLAPS